MLQKANSLDWTSIFTHCYTAPLVGHQFVARELRYTNVRGNYGQEPNDIRIHIVWAEILLYTPPGQSALLGQKHACANRIGTEDETIRMWLSSLLVVTFNLHASSPPFMFQYFSLLRTWLPFFKSFQEHHLFLDCRELYANTIIFKTVGDNAHCSIRSFLANTRTAPSQHLFPPTNVHVPMEIVFPTHLFAGEKYFDVVIAHLSN